MVMTTDTIGGTTFIGAVNKNVYVMAITASASGTLQSIGVNSAVAGGYIRVAVFQSSGLNLIVAWGAYGSLFSSWDATASYSNLLAQSSDYPIAAGWNDIPISSITITQGTTYYIAFRMHDTAENNLYYSFSGSEISFKEYSVSQVSDTFPDVIFNLVGLPYTHNTRITYG
jgi:hypothetical protein